LRDKILIIELVAYPFDVIRKKMQVQAVLHKRGEITHQKYFFFIERIINKSSNLEVECYGFSILSKQKE